MGEATDLEVVAHQNGNGAKAQAQARANGSALPPPSTENGTSLPVNGNGSLLPNGGSGLQNGSAGTGQNGSLDPRKAAPPRRWFEEELEEDLVWKFGVSKELHSGVSQFQSIELVESGPFGKVLLLDGKLQSSEADEFVYHECIVHPAVLYHKNPRSIFIMGGGEGSTAREALRHRSVKKVVMCDIDKEVVDFCRAHLTANAEAFRSSRLELVINCARAELESRNEVFDVIVGDLADPVDGGPCYQLYTQSFYNDVLKPRLSAGGIFVTQAGPAGILSHKEVYTSIFNTLRQVFKYVVPYAAHVPSYADTWGWIMASDHPFPSISVEETDKRIQHRIDFDLRFLDGLTLSATMALNKEVRKALEEETHVYTEKTARFLHGHGVISSI